MTAATDSMVDDPVGSAGWFGGVRRDGVVLGRRGMLAAIAGSTVGLAVLVSGCADDAVDEAVKARADATLPDPKMTPSQSGRGSARAPGGGRSAPGAAASPSVVDGPTQTNRVATALPNVAEPVPNAAPPVGSPAAPPSVSPASTPPAVARPVAPPVGNAVVTTPAPAPAPPPSAAPPSPTAPAPTPPAAPAPTPPRRSCSDADPPLLLRRRPRRSCSATRCACSAPPAAPAPPPPPPPPPADAGLEAMHRVQLLTKVTYGPTPEVIGQVASLGAVAFLEQQLRTAPASERGVLTGASTLGDNIETRYQAYRGQDSNRPAKELRLAAVIRAARHPGQLAERMVEFWTNHFSVYTGEDDKNVRYAAASDDRDVFRVHALGRFSDLLLANARSVSMQLYLDNYRSTGNQPNQNYAREVMELHTMGASNGYDEADVDEVARIFTGWGLAGRLGTDGLRFEYQANRHFTGPCEVTITLPDGSTSTFSTPGRTGHGG